MSARDDQVVAALDAMARYDTAALHAWLVQEGHAPPSESLEPPAFERAVARVAARLRDLFATGG